MRHLVRMRVENFQSHADTCLELTGGLNVVVGPTDQGKSALVRALRWCLYNQPRGADFRRVGTEVCRVTLEFSDGTVLGRERRAARNRYTVIRPGAEPRILEGFGAGVPAEVLEAHGMPELELDVDRSVSLNLSLQLDSPFLLAETGGTRAKAIGRLAGVHLLDLALRGVVRDLGREEERRRRLAEAETRLASELDAYDGLDRDAAALQQAEAAFRQAQELALRRQRIQGIAEGWRRVRAEREGLATLVGALRQAAQAEAPLAAAREMARRGQRLAQLALRVGAARRRRVRWERGLGATAGIEAAAGLLRRVGELRHRRERLGIICIRRESGAGAARRWQRVLELCGGLVRGEEDLRRLPELAGRRRVLRSAAARRQALGRRCVETRERLTRFEAASRLAAAWEERRERRRRLGELRSKLTGVRRRREEARGQVRSCQEELRSKAGLLQEALRRAEICPVCRRPVDGHTLERIVAEYLEGEGQWSRKGR